VAVLLNRGNRAAIAAAVDATDVSPSSAAADFGFGGGVGLELLLDRVGDHGVVHGVEIADDMLDRARSRFGPEIASGRLRLAHGSLTALPLDDESLDAAITVNTVYFVSDLDTASAEIARVLRPGGQVVVGVGDQDAMARLPFTSYGFTLRRITDVVAALENSGLDVVEQRPVDGAIAVTLLVARRR